MRFKLSNSQYADPLCTKHKTTLTNLCREDLIKAIRQQGKSNGMGTWEVDALIETFDRMKSLRKAYHILLEYAGLEKDIYKLISKRSSYMQKLLECLTAGDTESSLELPHVVSKLAEYSLKSWVSVCRWRQLQWSPRPISVQSRVSPTKSHFLYEFQRDIGILLAKARTSRISMIDRGVEPVHLVVVLATAAAEAVDDITIVNEILKSEAAPECDEPTDSRPGVRHALMAPFEVLIAALQEVSKEEVAAETTWQAFLSLKSGDLRMGVFPVLRLSYGSVMPPVVGSSDFPAAYRRTCTVLLDFFYRHYAEGGDKRNRPHEIDRHEMILRDLANMSGIHDHSLFPPDDGGLGGGIGGESTVSLGMYVHSHDTSIEDGVARRGGGSNKRNRPYSSPNARADREEKFTHSGPLRSDTYGFNGIDRSRQADSPSSLPSLDEFRTTPPTDGPSYRISPNGLHTMSYIDNGDEDDAIGPDSSHSNRAAPDADNYVSAFPGKKRYSAGPVGAAGRIGEGGAARRRQQRPDGRTRAASVETYLTSIGSGGGRIFETQLRIRGTSGCKSEYAESTCPLWDVKLETKRVRHGVQSCNKLVVAAYTPTCSADTKKAVLLGDEVIELGGYQVEGQFPSDVAAILLPYQRGEVLSIPTASIQRASRGPVTGGKKSNGHAVVIPVKLCRHYEGWEELHHMLKKFTNTAFSGDGDNAVVAQESFSKPASLSPVGQMPSTSHSHAYTLNAGRPGSDGLEKSVVCSLGRTGGSSRTSSEPAALDEYSRVISRIKAHIEVLEVQLREASQDKFLTVKEEVLKKYDELHEMQETLLEEKLRQQLAAPATATTGIGTDADGPDDDPIVCGNGKEDGDGEGMSEGKKNSRAVCIGKASEVRQSLRAQSMIKLARGNNSSAENTGSFPTYGNRLRSTSEDSVSTIGSDDDCDDEYSATSGVVTPSQMVAKAKAKAEERKASALVAIVENKSGDFSSGHVSIARKLPDRPTLQQKISNGTRSDSLKRKSSPVRISVRSGRKSPDSVNPTRTRLPGDANTRIPTRHVATTLSPSVEEAFVGSYRPTTTKKRRGLGRSGMVRQTELMAALAKVDLKNRHRSKRVRAGLKILEWWRLLYPRRKLLKRIEARDICHDLVYEFFELALARGLRSLRQRYNMMRQGAAVKVQRLFRHWKATHLNSYVRIQRAVRRYFARKAVLYIVKIVRAACRIGRFIYRRKIRLNHVFGKKLVYRRVIRAVLETVGLAARDRRQRELKITTPAVPRDILIRGCSDNKLLGTRRHDIYMKRLAACITIQGLFRIRNARNQVENARRVRDQRRQMLFTMCCVRLKRKILYRRYKQQCATLLQRVWRGASLRWKIMLEVLAGVKINAAWRKHRQYWKLKRCLRRIEIPVQIVLHGIRGIPANVLLSKAVKVRVSVWWTGLLHLVEQDDFMTVIQSKPPNIVRTTKLYDATDMPCDPLPVPVQTSPPQAPPPTPLRKMSMVQRAQLLRSKDSPPPEKTAADKLMEFAKLHGQNAAIKMAGSIKKDSRGDVPDVIEEGSIDDSKSKSDSSSSDDDEFSERSAGAAKSHFATQPDVVDPRMSMDSVGRESVHSLGSNLLPGATSDCNSSESVGRAPRTRGLSSQSFFNFSMRGGALDVETHKKYRHHRIHRNSLTPIMSGKISDNSDKGVLGIFGNVLMMTTALGAFKAPKELFNSLTHTDAEVPPKELGSLKYSVNLDDEDLYIPGCHGNSVIRFDFYDGERKFGTNVYQLASDQSLMFWGGELTRTIEVATTRQSNAMGNSVVARRQTKSLAQSGEAPPVLEVGIQAGDAGRSRCGWCMVRVKGNGPLKRRMRTKGFIKSFFDNWDHLFVSLDGKGVSFYEARNAYEPLISIILTYIKSIHIELLEVIPAANPNEKQKGAKLMEDKFVVVITTTSRDVVYLKFQEALVRENWVRTIVQAVDYSGNFLKKRLARQNIARDVANSGSNAAERRRR